MTEQEFMSLSDGETVIYGGEECEVLGFTEQHVTIDFGFGRRQQVDYRSLQLA